MKPAVWLPPRQHDELVKLLLIDLQRRIRAACNSANDLAAVVNDCQASFVCCESKANACMACAACDTAGVNEVVVGVVNGVSLRTKDGSFHGEGPGGELLSLVALYSSDNGVDISRSLLSKLYEYQVISDTCRRPVGFCDNSGHQRINLVHESHVQDGNLVLSSNTLLVPPEVQRSAQSKFDSGNPNRNFSSWLSAKAWRMPVKALSMPLENWRSRLL